MSVLDELSDEELDEVRYVWLARLMFNPLVGWAPELRSLEEFAEAWRR